MERGLIADLNAEINQALERLLSCRLILLGDPESGHNPLQIEFGEQETWATNQGKVSASQWVFRIWRAGWRVQKWSEIIAGDLQKRDRLEKVIEMLRHHKLKRLEIESNFLDTTFIFDQGFTIKTFTMDEYAQQWFLGAPGGKLLVTASNGKSVFNQEGKETLI